MTRQSEAIDDKNTNGATKNCSLRRGKWQFLNSKKLSWMKDFGVVDED